MDEADLLAVKQAAEREGRPEAELIREAFHLVAVRSARWTEDWDIPTFALGGRVSPSDVDDAVREGIAGQ